MDQENDGRDVHLGKIVDSMVEWDTKLAPALGLTSTEVHDIKETHRDKPAVERSALVHACMYIVQPTEQCHAVAIVILIRDTPSECYSGTP